MIGYFATKLVLGLVCIIQIGCGTRLQGGQCETLLVERIALGLSSAQIDGRVGDFAADFGPLHGVGIDGLVHSLSRRLQIVVPF